MKAGEEWALAKPSSCSGVAAFYDDRSLNKVPRIAKIGDLAIVGVKLSQSSNIVKWLRVIVYQVTSDREDLERITAGWELGVWHFACCTQQKIQFFQVVSLANRYRSEWDRVFFNFLIRDPIHWERGQRGLGYFLVLW